MYLSGIAIIFLCALLINKITSYKAQKKYFIIELPEYKFPSLWGAFKSMCARGREYIIKAATIILLCNTVVHILQTFNLKLTLVNHADESLLAIIAQPFAYLLLPVVGILSWQLAAAAITGFIAKENVVGTLAVCFSVTNFIDTEELLLIGGATEIAAVMGLTKITALAYLVFNLFSPPCFAAIGAMNAELNNAKYLWGGIGLQLSVGFTAGYLVNTIGTLIYDAEKLNPIATISGGIAIICISTFIIYLILSANKKLKSKKVATNFG